MHTYLVRATSVQLRREQCEITQGPLHKKIRARLHAFGAVDADPALAILQQELAQGQSHAALRSRPLAMHQREVALVHVAFAQIRMQCRQC